MWRTSWWAFFSVCWEPPVLELSLALELLLQVWKEKAIWNFEVKKVVLGQKRKFSPIVILRIGTVGFLGGGFHGQLGFSYVMSLPFGWRFLGKSYKSYIQNKSNKTYYLWFRFFRNFFLHEGRQPSWRMSEPRLGQNHMTKMEASDWSKFSNGRFEQF